jgi:hypothetical protein
MTDIDLVLTYAERIKKLRADLAEAERELEAVVRGRSPKPVPRLDPLVSTPTNTAPLPPVTQRVAKYLARFGASEFGAIVKGVQPATPFAVKSALKTARAKGEVEFKDGLYGPKTQKPSRGRPRRVDTAGSGVTS